MAPPDRESRKVHAAPLARKLHRFTLVHYYLYDVFHAKVMYDPKTEIR
jgi:hypothetical protein